MTSAPNVSNEPILDEGAEVAGELRMDIAKIVRDVPPVRKLNSVTYHYRAKRWMAHPRFWLGKNSVRIDRPVFLLGTQGGGLTLTARMLRRSPEMVSVTGNASYWAGADEIQNVLQPILPEVLSWRGISLWHHTYKNHNWLYASDALYPYYHATAAEASRGLRRRFRDILRGILNMNRPLSGASYGRLIDKSQSYTLRIGLINRLLGDCRPKFLLLVRNPFASCWRAVTRDGIVSNLPLDKRGKLELAIQHWRNSMQSALDGREDADLEWWRFEDLLRAPEMVLHQICEFLGLRFTSYMLPSAGDRIPWGSAYDAFVGVKWYPVRPDVNDRYLAEIPHWARSRVWEECRDLIQYFGYAREGRSNENELSWDGDRRADLRE